MPTYEFRCPAGHDFERFYKTMSAAPSQVDCPECGAVSSRQLSGGGGLLFKGSGFYLTDYGKNAHRKSAPDTTSGGTEGGARERPAGESTSESGPRADAPKTDSPKTDSAKTDRPKGDGPKADGPKADSPKTDRSKAEGPVPKHGSKRKSE